MKRVISIIACGIMLAFALAACGKGSDPVTENITNESQETSTREVENQTDETEGQADSADELIPSGSDILVVNFSCTGNTKPIAEKIADYLNADLYEIIPVIPYTDDDINYNDDNCRANKEQADDSARPEIAGEKIDMSAYDTVIISFPIWWGKEPRIIDTFMESYDLSGKTLTCFCTSGSSGIVTAETNLHAYVPDGNWLDGIRFEAGASDGVIEEWAGKLREIDMNMKIKITVGNKTMTAVLEDNTSARALVELIGDGAYMVTGHNYGDFEKVCKLGANIEKNDTYITTKPGDIVLYQGSNICFYYDTNSWDFTMLGHIEDLSDSEIRDVLSGPETEITLENIK